MPIDRFQQILQTEYTWVWHRVAKFFVPLFYKHQILYITVVKN